ncbi:hypothetical protein, partial [uncultured Rubinisphaera sp.]|uniref:hypothetical protein n=1 Tax=uncultured Rubinisphaera sp. TaxID=1678686 RepID=UPI0030DB3769
MTDRGEEACEEMRKRRVCMSSPPGSLLVKAARLRTEASYNASSGIREDGLYPNSSLMLKSILVEETGTYQSG